MSNNKQNSEEQNHGYICPVTKVQCDDERCVSAEDCHIKSGYGILSSNNNPGNIDNNTMSMTELRKHITMYLDDIESYGTRKELADATDVLFDFVKYINAMYDEQAMIDYNAMEEEWEMDNYNEMKDEQE